MPIKSKRKTTPKQDADTKKAAQELAGGETVGLSPEALTLYATLATGFLAACADGELDQEEYDTLGASFNTYPTSTYHLSVSVHPAATEGVNCTTYPSTNVPQTIGPGTGLVSSTITVPGNPRIADLDVEILLNHAVMNHIDAHLRSPAGNDIGLFTDIGAAATGGQTQMDTVFDDEAGMVPACTALKGLQVKPENNSTAGTASTSGAYRLNLVDGENAGGTWTLDLRDDVADANGGTLTSWSLRVWSAWGRPTSSWARS